MKKNINNYNFLLKNFLKSNNHIGLEKKLTKKEIYPFLYGIRSDFCIINLNITINIFKRICKLIQNILNNNNKILIVGNNIQTSIFKNILKSKDILFFSNKKINDFLINKKKNNIGVVIFLNTGNNDILLKYINNLNIPTIGFINTNNNLKYLTYSILKNNNNLKSLFFIIYLLKNILKKKKNESF